MTTRSATDRETLTSVWLEPGGACTVRSQNRYLWAGPAHLQRWHKILLQRSRAPKKPRPLGGVCPEVCLLVFKHLVELEDKLRLQQLFEMQPQQASLGLPSNHRCKGILQDSRYEKIAISTRFCEPACCVAVQTSDHTKETSVCAFMCAAWCTHLLKSVMNGMPMPYASA